MDLNKLFAEAQAELESETITSAKAKIKAKLRELKNAERIVANIKLEIEALMRDLQ